MSPYNLCDGCGFVCENHPNLSWQGASDSPYSCGCGAGMPCPGCISCKGLLNRADAGSFDIPEGAFMAGRVVVGGNVYFSQGGDGTGLAVLDRLSALGMAKRLMEMLSPQSPAAQDCEFCGVPYLDAHQADCQSIPLDLRSQVDAITHSALPPSGQPLGTQARARVQVQIADGAESLLRREVATERRRADANWNTADRFSGLLREHGIPHEWPA